MVARGQHGRGPARLLRWATAPLELASRVLLVFDEALSWVGGNLLLASGGVTLLVWLSPSCSVLLQVSKRGSGVWRGTTAPGR